MDVLRLYVSVPVACFRVAQAREFWETYPCPPPSTVYGMLLSLVGEPNRLIHKGAEIALALVSKPERSIVLRSLWRVKDTKAGPGLGNNKRPDFQEVLTDIRLSIWVRRGNSESSPIPLMQRLNDILQDPRSAGRFGGLSLGESTHLVDEVRLWGANDPLKGKLLIADEKGNLSLPVWPDHVGSKGTLWGQFKLEDAADFDSLALESYVPAWIRIRPPEEE